MLCAAPSCTPPADTERAEASSEVTGEAAPEAAILHPAAAPPAQSRTSGASSASSFTLFESGQVRPLALSPDGHHLFATNTPDNRLEIFRIEPHRLVHTGSIPVGLEPVAVAARSDREV
ncbi:MAG TPA: hypothetical protein VHW23_07885, partial [Kofleriaceae bacterium]|nr:hypothetical protein [Kofleriaceae bacterium]